MEVRVFKLNNGEEFLAELVDANDEGVDVKHPVILVSDGSGGHSFTPWISTTSQTDFWLPATDIRFMEESVAELDEAYKNLFGEKSAILTPSTNILLG